ncbi:pseudouridine synthase [Dermabacteraceae bacterium P13136]
MSAARKRSAFNAPKKVTLRASDGSKVRGNAEADVHREDGIRLQKVLAEAGFGSRRACEVIIAQGRVSVDGTVVTGAGVRIDPQQQVVHVDGRRLQLRQELVTYALNKPRRVVSAMSDPQGRRDLSDFVADIPERVYHVGRLDYETEGLLLLTNDGELAHRLTHPSFSVEKTYVCAFDCPGQFPRGLLKNLRDGVELEDGPAKADAAKLIAHNGHEAVVEVTLHEGRNRIVRRMFASQGYELTRLVRTRIGSVLLGNQPAGKLRPVQGKELGTLMAQVGL